MLKVIKVKDSNIKWDFSSKNPYFSTRNGSEIVDPFPAYAHDKELVEEISTKVADAFPLDIGVYIYLSAYENTSRTNGHTEIKYDYNNETDEGTYPIKEGIIVLSGKRIPPHPAMTRYLVAHEYGHVVDYWLQQTNKNLRTEYAKMRKMTAPKSYGGRTWHKSVGEVIANDFRVIVCSIEEEFWPHDVKRPETVKGVRQFWKEALSKVK